MTAPRPRSRTAASCRAAHRVVVKVGSSSLTDVEGGLDDDRLGALVDALAAQAPAGREVLLVSSGAIAAGLAPLAARAARATWPPSRPQPASGRACSSRATPRPSPGTA